MKICKCGKEYEPVCKRTCCLECRRKYDKQWRIKRLKQGLKVRGNPPPKKWWDNYYKKYYSKPEVKKRINELAKKYRNDPKLRMKHEARWQVAKAIKLGLLKKEPCIKCGNVKSEAHHKDYYKPLKVIWLCREHHRAEHAKAERG